MLFFSPTALLVASLHLHIRHLRFLDYCTLSKLCSSCTRLFAALFDSGNTQGTQITGEKASRRDKEQSFSHYEIACDPHSLKSSYISAGKLESWKKHQRVDSMARRRKNSSVTIAREDLAALNGHGGSANGVAGGSGQINAGLVSVSAKKSRIACPCTRARDGYWEELQMRLWRDDTGQKTRGYS